MHRGGFEMKDWSLTIRHKKNILRYDFNELDKQIFLRICERVFDSVERLDKPDMRKLRDKMLRNN